MYHNTSKFFKCFKSVHDDYLYVCAKYGIVPSSVVLFG